MKHLRKLRGLTLFIAILGSMFISSCNQDTTGDVTPTVSFKAGGSYVSTDVSLDSGTVFTVGVTAFANANSNAKLEDVTLTITYNNSIILTRDSSIKASSFQSDYDLKVTWVGSAKLKVLVTDKDGQTQETSINITGTKQGTGQTLVSHPNLTMGGSASSYGSYLDAETGTVYSQSQVSGSATIKNSIDIIFDNAIFYNTATIIPSSTGTKFATTTLSSANFDAITTDATFGTYSATLNQVTIAAGNVIFFQTLAGKKGLIKIKSMTSPTGDLSIDLKVQP